jgi:hypothetical protein
MARKPRSREAIMPRGVSLEEIKALASFPAKPFVFIGEEFMALSLKL